MKFLCQKYGIMIPMDLALLLKTVWYMDIIPMAVLSIILKVSISRETLFISIMGIMQMMDIQPKKQAFIYML